MPAPVNTFVGHSDVVLEFQWRSQALDGKRVYYGIDPLFMLKGGGMGHPTLITRSGHVSLFILSESSSRGMAVQHWNACMK